jgi:hypothetical protein
VCIVARVEHRHPFLSSAAMMTNRTMSIGVNATKQHDVRSVADPLGSVVDHCLTEIRPLWVPFPQIFFGFFSRVFPGRSRGFDSRRLHVACERVVESSKWSVVALPMCVVRDRPNELLLTVDVLKPNNRKGLPWPRRVCDCANRRSTRWWVRRCATESDVAQRDGSAVSLRRGGAKATPSGRPHCCICNNANTCIRVRNVFRYVLHNAPIPRR